jgi:hypothetical protein
MATQKSDSPEPTATKPAKGPAPSARSEALEAELAMLEAMLPAETERPAQSTRVDPATDCGGTQ